MTNGNGINLALENLLTSNKDIQGALVATADGIALASVQLSTASNRLAAMASASIGLGKQLIATICNGNLNEIKVSGDNGQVFIYSVTNKAVLVVITREEPNVAMVNWESQKTVKELVPIIQ